MRPLPQGAARQAVATMPAKCATFSQLARLTLEQMDGDARLAEVAVTNLLIDDPALLARLVKNEIKAFAADAIGRKLRNDNYSIVRASAVRNAPVALAGGLVRGFLDWRLSDGSRLGDADRKRVTECSDRYQGYAESNARNWRWLRSIAQGLPDGKLVRDVYGEERLRDLFQEAQNG